MMIKWLQHHNRRSALIKLHCYLISIKLEIIVNISMQWGIGKFLLCIDARATQRDNGWSEGEGSEQCK
jgi:hypothetical protein